MGPVPASPSHFLLTRALRSRWPAPLLRRTLRLPEDKPCAGKGSWSGSSLIKLMPKAELFLPHHATFQVGTEARDQHRGEISVIAAHAFGQWSLGGFVVVKPPTVRQTPGYSMPIPTQTQPQVDSRPLPGIHPFLGVETKLQAPLASSMLSLWPCACPGP